MLLISPLTLKRFSWIAFFSVVSLDAVSDERSFKCLLSLKEVPMLNVSPIYSCFILFSVEMSPTFMYSDIILYRFSICSIGLMSLQEYVTNQENVKYKM